MATHGSAPTRKHESHARKTQVQTKEHQRDQRHYRGQAPLFQTSNTRTFQIKSEVISPDLKRRARRLAVESRVDHSTRRLIRYALENRDPYLVQLVTRVEAGERRIEHLILDTN